MTELRGTQLQVRDAVPEDWPLIWPFYSAIIEAGETIAFPDPADLESSRSEWMASPPDHTVVAVSGDRIVGSARMGPNRPARGSHIATAAFMVDPAFGRQGVGRVLGDHAIEWARMNGYHGMQFNAVVETNVGAVRLWKSLGFEIVGTVPGAFDHRKHGLVGMHVMFRVL